MSTRTQRLRTLSVEEYLEGEKHSTARHEYVAGETYALSGASKRHNEISLNIAIRLRAVAREQGCRVYMNDVKVRAGEEVIYYPDVMVACGPDTGDEYVEDAPCLIVEVTSPSTASTDRREKLAVYKRIPTLRSYLIVDQERRHVQHIHCDENGEWWHGDAVGRGSLILVCPEMKLPLDDIYLGTGVGE